MLKTLMTLGIACLICTPAALADDIDQPIPPPTNKLRLLSPANNMRVTAKWSSDENGEDAAYGYVKFTVAGPRGLTREDSDDHLYMEMSRSMERDEDGAFVDPISWGWDEIPYMDWFRPIFPRGRYTTYGTPFEPGTYYWHVFISHNCEDFDADECTMEFSMMRKFTIRMPRRPIPDSYE